MKILVTGATGFIGGALSAHLQNTEGYQVVGTTRQNLKATRAGVRLIRIGTTVQPREWSAAMKDVDAIVHCAARVHQNYKKESKVRSLYYRDNTVNTLSLARIAADEGVKRFVLLSTLKVHGESSKPGTQIRAEDPLDPRDLYAKSKHQAEEGLWKLASTMGFEAIVVRPPLVYGPGVKANFASLIGLLNRGFPLPLAALNNRRSLVYIQNLVSLLTACLTSKNAVGEAFLVSDGHNLSVHELAVKLLVLLGKPPRLTTLSPSVIRILLTATGKRTTARRIIDSFEVDISKTERMLNWAPPYTADQGLKATVEYWRNNPE